MLFVVAVVLSSPCLGTTSKVIARDCHCHAICHPYDSLLGIRDINIRHCGLWLRVKYTKIKIQNGLFRFTMINIVILLVSYTIDKSCPSHYTIGKSCRRQYTIDKSCRSHWLSLALQNSEVSTPAPPISAFSNIDASRRRERQRGAGRHTWRRDMVS